MKRLSILVLAGLTACAAPALAVNESVGMNLGLANVRPERGEPVTEVMVPGDAFGFQPGLRIGIAGESLAHEFHLDAGVFHLSPDSGQPFSFMIATGSYQYTFASGSGTAPFATAGLGFFLEDTGGETPTSLVVGGGLGVRSRIAENHGTFRIELHVDHFAETDYFAGMSVISLRLGFDLWMRSLAGG
jgi:hypothetical protein